MMSVPARNLGDFLEQLQATYHRPDFLGTDPLEFVHRYSNPLDQEAVALLSALLAYGNVKQIRRSVEDALARIARLSCTPAEFVRSLRNSPFRARAEEVFGGFTHRFNQGQDVILLFRLLSESWKRHGSLGAHFVSKLDPCSETIAEALGALIGEWRDWALAQRSEARRGGNFDYLLTSPSDGSCCKRWCMLLRWMGRKDQLDPGLWSANGALSSGFPPGRALSARQLVIPLDTHTGRISQYLGLTRRKTLNWKAAVEVTRGLRSWDPDDPTRYDFAISRLGILDLCQRHYREEICTRCQLVSVCKFARKKRHPRAKLGLK